jgi:hypothetical protein
MAWKRYVRLVKTKKKKKKKKEATIQGKVMTTVVSVLWDAHGVILLRRLVLLINTARQLDLTVSVCCQKEF